MKGTEGVGPPASSPLDLRVHARPLAFLFGAGATLLLLSLTLPHPAQPDERGLLGIAVTAYSVTAFLVVAPRRLGTLAHHLILAFGTGLISLGVYYAGADTAYATFYVWVALYAFYFFTSRQAFTHLLLVAAAYASVLVVLGSGPTAGRWLLTVGTAAVTGLFVGRLVEEVRRRAAEAAGRAGRLAAAQRRTRSILETANDGFFATDRGGTIVDVNRESEQLTGRPRADLVGSSLADVLVGEEGGEDLARRLLRSDPAAEQAVASRTVEFTMRRRDGHEFPAEASVSALHEDGGWALSLFVRDITDRKRAERHMREQIEDLEVVASVARDLAGVTSAHAARPAICKAAVQLTGAAVGILYEPDAKGVALESTAVSGGSERVLRLPFAGPRSGARTAFSSGRPKFVADVDGNSSVQQRISEEQGVVSALWQPILRDGVAIGVLAVGWRERVASLTPRVASLIALLAAEAAVSIERADLLGRLEAVARTDELTGLANRRALEEHLPRELARADRDEQPLCIALLDLDHFKAFNDHHGHPAGDRLLKEVTAAWRTMLRPSDLIARYGGEEFLLVLPNCDIEGAMDVVERLRAVCAAGQTCSAGVVEWDGTEPGGSLVDRVDRALYDAKRSGRDRAIIG